MQLAEIGHLVHLRRTEIGLSQQSLANLSHLSRLTINQLERGTLKDLGIAKVIGLGRLLGIDISAQIRPATENGLLMATVTSSISLRKQMNEQILAQALASGEIPPGFKAHIGTLLGEAPLPVLIRAIEEAARREAVAPRRIWANVHRWAKNLRVVRPELRN